jgi:ubiquitin C-terminal hydrolase
MTLTIKGKNSVLEALSSFVEGDMLDGENAYFCEGCNKKVDTLKRTCIKVLPNVCILPFISSFWEALIFYVKLLSIFLTVL